MNEINLPQNVVIALCIVLGLLVIHLWHHLGAYQLHIEPKKSSEGNYTPKLTNTNYGAYIQLAGRRYN